MSVQVTYVPPGRMPQLAAGADLPSVPPLRLEIGGDAALVAAEGNPPALALTNSMEAEDKNLALFVLIDLGGHRTLIYVLGDEPVYVDGEATFAAVLSASSPCEGRHVIRSERLPGAIQIAPAHAVRRLAVEDGSCAYCSGPIKVGEVVVVCGCSAEVAVHGFDNNMNCWKRTDCTKCGWSLIDAELAEGVEFSQDVDHGTP